MGTPDAVVVGSGPNGLAAAIELSRHGLEVLVIEGHTEIGGGTRTAEVTLPGVRHDVCSAAHPLVPSSPFLSTLPLDDHGLTWVDAPAPMAHVLDDGVVMMERDIGATAERLGGEDGERYRQILDPFVDRYPDLASDILRPLLRPPRHPLLMARFGAAGLVTGHRLTSRFRSMEARALLAGLIAHSCLPFSHLGTAATGLVLAAAGHHNGWPIVRGGSQRLTEAMASYLRSLSGRIETGQWVERLSDLPNARAILLDVAPHQFLSMAGGQLSARRRRPYRTWKYGVGTFKIDYAVDRPIPWTAEEAARSATVHVGGTYEEIAEAEAMVWRGGVPDRPFVLVTQPTLFDPTRAPAGIHTVWAYAHVPASFEGDLTATIDRQIERFAPGFVDTVLARHVTTTRQFAAYNPNNVGGSISGGAMSLPQLLGRPRWSPWPHATPVDGVYLCSASTAPGPGTHGMCGFHAARTALNREFGIRPRRG